MLPALGQVTEESSVFVATNAFVIDGQDPFEFGANIILAASASNNTSAVLESILYPSDPDEIYTVMENEWAD